MRNRVRLVLAFLFVLAVAPACGSPEFPVTGTERAAGADGMIRLEELDGGNVLVEIEMEHLPPPSRLGQGLTTYVVWFTPQGGQPQKAGALGYDDDNRSGRMTATSPQSAFEVVISAERGINVTNPSDIVVARRRVNVND